VGLANAPRSFPSTDRVLYSDTVVKARDAAAHGAIGAIVIWAGEVTKNTPWEQIVRFFHQPVMQWLDSEGRPNDYVPELRAIALTNQASANLIFKGSAHGFDEALASLEKSQPMSFPLAGTAVLHEAPKFDESESPNVVGLLRGSDSTLRNEYIVFTAHADHAGIGDPVNGDAIYNGAADNASGTAALLEIARAFGESKDRPKRSLLFVVVAGEEDGLLGSDYFRAAPDGPSRTTRCEHQYCRPSSRVLGRRVLGLHEGAGVNDSHAKCNCQMRRVLNRAANAAAKTKGSIFALVYRRLGPRLGRGQTIGAIAHRRCRLT
jgi:hypothetical protein